MNLISIAAAAKLMGWSRLRVERAIEEGQFRPLHIGSKRMLDREEVRMLAAKTQDKGVGIEELSEETGLAVGAIRTGIAEGWIPCWRKGRAYRFDLHEVIRAIRLRIEEQNNR